MKVIKEFVVIIFTILLMTSCNQGGSDIKIGFLIPAGKGFRWPTDQRYVEAEVSRLGYSVTTLSADNDENAQMKNATELLKSGVDVLIVVPVNSNTSAAIVREAHEYGVPVIAYDRLIMNSDLDCFVTFEGEQIGKIMVDHALDVVPKGNYVLLWGDPGDLNAIYIKNAQEKLLKPYIDNGNVNVVYKGFVDNWSKDNAYHKMNKILSYSNDKIDVVLTSYDGLAIGALKAIEEQSVTTVKVLTGQDAELDAIRSIVDGRMSLTVYKSIRDIANASVDLAVKLAKGEKIEQAKGTVNNGRKDVPTMMIKPVAVQKDNIRSVVIDDEYYTEVQVYGK